MQNHNTHLDEKKATVASSRVEVAKYQNIRAHITTLPAPPPPTVTFGISFIIKKTHQARARARRCYESPGEGIRTRVEGS